MTQEVLVDLDLHLNRIMRVADATSPTDAVAYGQLGNYVSVPPPVPGTTPPGTTIVWDGSNWVYVDPGHPSAPVSKTTSIIAGDGLNGGGDLSQDRFIGMDLGQALTFNPGPPTPTAGGGGVTLNLGAGIQFGADATSGTPLPQGDFIQVDKTVLDGWYPAVPTPPTTGDGSTIIWDSSAGTPSGTGAWVPVGPTDPNAPVPKTTQIIAGAGLVGGGDLSAHRTLDVVAYPNGGIRVEPDGIFVDTGAGLSRDVTGVSVNIGDGVALVNDSITVNAVPAGGIGVDASGVWVDAGQGVSRSTDGVTVNLGTGLAFGDDPSGIGPAGDYVAVDKAWLDNEIAIAASNVTAGVGLDMAPGVAPAPDTIFVKPDLLATNALTVSPAGTLVPKVVINPVGMVTALETGVNQWAVGVSSLQLANTYVGPGVDSGTINNDLGNRIPPVTAMAGDIYINNAVGIVFIHSGLATPNDWVTLATPVGYITAITSPDSSIDVTDAGGPAAKIQVSAALQAAINGGVASTTQVLGGLGLSGGGPLTGDITLDVVVEDDSGLVADANALWINTGEGIKRDTNGISVDRTEVDTWYPVIGGTPPQPGDILVWDPAAGTPPGTGAWVPSTPTAVGSAAVKAGDVTTDGLTPATFVHGLNSPNGDVVVSVKTPGLTGCYVEASVCGVDANTISIETATAGTYRVIVTGIQG